MQCPIQNCQYETPDLGDAIVAAHIITHCRVHTSAAAAVPGTLQVEKVKRPIISTGGSSEEWSYFLTRWGDYVQATGIANREAVIQLLECCDESLRKDLTCSAGGSLLNKTPNEVLASIKVLAVREENVMVARVNIHNMRQDRDESIRAFGARIRGQAGICKYSTKCLGCNADVIYAGHILRDVLTRGLDDHEYNWNYLGILTRI